MLLGETESFRSEGNLGTHKDLCGGGAGASNGALSHAVQCRPRAASAALGLGRRNAALRPGRRGRLGSMVKARMRRDPTVGWDPPVGAT